MRVRRESESENEDCHRARLGAQEAGREPRRHNSNTNLAEQRTLCVAFANALITQTRLTLSGETTHLHIALAFVLCISSIHTNPTRVSWSP